MTSPRGLFITLEGVEGAGKTTQIPLIVAHLEQAGWPCVATREPGGTEIGRQIRKIVLDPENTHVAPETEWLLYMADRAQHVHEFIEPNLAAGRSVVSDRFADATAIYQGHARGLGVERIARAHDLVFQGLTPDLTIVFDLDPGHGLQRARRRLAQDSSLAAEGRLDSEETAFHEKVRQGYLDLAQAEPDRLRVIDAEPEAESVTQKIRAVLDEFLSHRTPPGKGA